MVDDLRHLVQAFESGSLPRQDWNHAAHLAVAVWYLETQAEPLKAICAGIQAYNAAQGIEQTPQGGYHESLTRFLTLGIQAYLQACPAKTLSERLVQVQRDFKAMGSIWREYYSPECFQKSRFHWIKPDLKSWEQWLDFCQQQGAVAP